ncbi:glycosyltransferase family 2 protein [Cyclobacterium salsum]|uniref:glycosyltransferase family 2 protein n=1 Tax=Cyclobacterium salsum TaxID=2666329 RepID=UPI00139193D6|nr:glycosyltransferase family 2 protein [Cyclobacterium salsum]
MSSTIDLTIAIPVKNEEKNLPGCLKAIGKDFAKHVVVIDSGSTDRTSQIAKEADVEVIEFKWNGRYPKKRNWFLEHRTPQTKWILFLDADEHINEKFKMEVRKKLPKTTNSGFLLAYNIHFMGKKLKGGYPLKKLALFQVGQGKYERIIEENWSKFDMEIHEHPIIEGKIGKIKSKIDHLDYQGVSHYVTKHNVYSDWEARRFLRFKKDKYENPLLDFNQRIKYRCLNYFWFAPSYFLGSFFLMGGFLDGYRGVAFAILKSAYFSQIYCKIKEIEK